jgi:hypothetical protein
MESLKENIGGFQDYFQNFWENQDYRVNTKNTDGLAALLY